MFEIRKLKEKIEKSETTVEDYLELSRLYYRRNDYKNALKYALEAKQLDKKCYKAVGMLTEIYIDEEKYIKARKSLQELEEIAPVDYYPQYYYGTFIFMHIDEERIAKKYRDKLLALQKDDDAKYCDLVYLAFSTTGEDADMEIAVKYLKKYISLNFPKIDLGAVILYVYVSLWLAFPKIQQFSISLFELFNIFPNCDCLLTRAEIEEAKEEWEKALKLYKKVLKKNSSYTQCYHKISNCYFKMEDFKSALEYINLSILNFPDSEANYHIKADILVQLDRYEEAIKTLETLEKINPQHKNLHYAISRIYLLMEDENNSSPEIFEKALTHINKQLLIKKNYSLYSCKMIILNKLCKYNEVIETGKEALKLDDDVYGYKSDTYNELAYAYGMIEDYSNALLCINKAILLDGDNLGYFHLKAGILLDYRKYEAAIETLKEALKLGEDNLDNANVYSHLTSAYRCKEDYSNALSCINKAILLKGDNPAYYAKKAEILNDCGKYEEAETAHLRAIELGWKDE